MLCSLFDHHHVFCMVRINSSGCQKAPRLNRRWSFVHILSWFENTRGVWLMISFFLQGDFIMSHSAQNKLKPQQTVVKCGSGSIPSWSVNDSRLLKSLLGWWSSWRHLCSLFTFCCSGCFRQHLQELLGLRLCRFGRHQRDPRRLWADSR